MTEDFQAPIFPRKKTIRVEVGGVAVGGGAPISVQTMTNTDTADAESTAAQCISLAEAGADMVRITVNTDEAAGGVPEIRRRMDDAGCTAPLIGDFHYNGHLLLTRHPDCARALDKYRINPGNVGRGGRRDENFRTVCRLAADLGKAVRIGVNSGSLDPELVALRMGENASSAAPLPGEAILGRCMIESMLASCDTAVETGLGRDRIVLSCKSSRPTELVRLHRELAARTEQPLHIGLTEAGLGLKGVVWSAASLAILLAEGIGDTLRISLTPSAGGDRREEVWACCELLQSLGLRTFFPSVTACPGCGRTSGAAFQRLAEDVQAFLRDRMPHWRSRYPGVEALNVAVMGCIVNGPGESRAADIGISLPGSGESPKCPVYVDGEHHATLEGTRGVLFDGFRAILEQYVERRFGNGE